MIMKSLKMRDQLIVDDWLLDKNDQIDAASFNLPLVPWWALGKCPHN